jgi:radical SAM superfamily enzyme YgiQ (UPF0313 family)
VVNAHINVFDQVRAEHLAAAGCTIVKFGLESGSERIRREVLNRKMSNEKIQKSIQLANDNGLHSSVFLMIGLPGESLEDLMATIKLTASSLPGRFRWSFFYPFPGTRAYDITMDLGYLDREKQDSLTNFTEDSCLDFGPEHNLFLEKVGKILPWYVNAYSTLPVAEFYQEKIQELEDLNHEEWKRREKTILDEDAQISKELSGQGLSYYAIKYNPFMGVISDYFLNEK